MVASHFWLKWCASSPWSILATPTPSEQSEGRDSGAPKQEEAHARRASVRDICGVGDRSGS